MNHRVGNVQEERLPVVAIDESQRLLRVPPGEERLILGHLAHHVAVAQQRQGRVIAWIERHERTHVVRVGQSEVIVEAVIVGQELGLVAQMPLPDYPRGIAALLEHFRDRELVGVDSLRIGRHENRVPEAGLKSVADGIASGHQGRSRRRADRLGVEAG